MKTLSSAFQSRLSDNTTLLATCWKVTRRDSTVLGFTDYSTSLIYDSVTYIATSGFLPSAVEAKAGVEIDNQEVVGLLDDNGISEADILAGRYDGAEIEVFHLLPDELSAGALHLISGHIGAVTVQGGRFIADIRGLGQQLNKRVGELYSPLCRARLGDSRCGKNLSSFTVTATIAGAASQRECTISSLTQPDGYFNNGSIAFTSGDNNGFSMDIKHQYGTVLTLALPMPYAISGGDAVTLVAGCDKRLETCVNVFDNAVNFRGEPHLPGLDKAMETAGTRSS